MLVSTSVPSLVNGVSQQAENFRFPSQCTEQLNGFSSVLRGLLKRPPTQHVTTFTPGSDSFVAYPIVRSTTERFILILGDRMLKVFTLAGVEVPVKRPDGVPVSPTDLTYLQTSAPRTSLYPLTVADYTVLLNQEKTVALKSTVTPNVPPAALVFVKQFRQNATYRIRLYDTPSALSATHDFSTTSSDAAANQGTIVAALRNYLSTTPSAEAVYEHNWEGPVMHIRKRDASDFRIEVESSIPDGMAVFKDVAQSFSLLPKKAWVGYQLRISGDPEASGDEYYIKYVGQDQYAGGFAEGSWEESQAFGLKDQLDPTTLPHALENHGDYFVYRPIDWGQRTCGDETTNPPPSFVGRTIRDVFFHRNRLGLLTDENAVLSEASEFWNFWRTTVIQLLDSDPIDIGAAHTKVALLNSAVASSKKLLIFSDGAQFSLEGGDLLTPKSAALPLISENESLPTVRPRALGKTVLFPFKRGDFSGFSEYAVDVDSLLFEAYDVTEHCPAYLRGEVEAFDVSPVCDMLVAKTSGSPDSLYVYQFFKQQNQRLQSAWHRWVFSGAEVRSFFIVGTELFLLLKRGTTYTIEVMELDTGVTDTGSSFTVLLDRRVSETGLPVTYNSALDTSTYTLPYVPVSPSVYSRATETSSSVVSIPIVSTSGNTVTLRGNTGASHLWFGENYSMTVTLTRPLLRTARSDGSSVISTERFQVRRGLLTFNDTLAFRVEITPRGRQTLTCRYEPRKIGTLTARTGEAPEPQDGVFSFGVFSKNDQVTIKLVNDTALPCALLSIDWEALYQPRAQKL